MNVSLAQLTPLQRYHLLSSVVVPRPIAWVTTQDEAGRVNAAPFSYFQLMGDNPALVVLGIGRRPDGSDKDTFRNLRRSGEYVINLVTEENATQMNLTATDFPPDLSEVEILHLATAPSAAVKPPRLLISPVHLEVREVQTLLIGETQIVIGEVLHFHIEDQFIDNQSMRIQTQDMHLIGRLQGGREGGYTRTRDTFDVKRLTYAEWQAQQQQQ